jgi:hypothetical protein
MTVYKLRKDQIDEFAELPEIAMATQVAADKEGTAHVIASDRIAVRFDGDLERDLSSRNEFFSDDSLLQNSHFPQKRKLG